MRLSERFYPKEEIINSLTYRDQKKVKVLLVGDIICAIMFLVFGAMLLAMQHYTTGPLMILICLFYVASMFLVKAGRMINGSYLATLGLAAACFIVAFFTSFHTDPLVTYRTTCFCVTLAAMNFIIALRKGQIILNMSLNILLHVSSIFILHFPDNFMEDPKEWIAGLMINGIAIVGEGFILQAAFKSNDEIVEHSEKEHAQVAESLSTITTVLGDVKESMNIGQKLNNAVDSASSSITTINEIYEKLVKETDHLNVQASNVENSSRKVSESSSVMAEGIEQQNGSLEEVSSAITEISANISNINLIAERRRAGMANVTNNLKSQDDLIRKIVVDVDKVQESSQRIAEFVKTVEGIAQQTNLLAMNASIEAAHSGINGKGFSVIAQEIRKLSEQTTQNATKISETLESNSIVVKETTDSVKNFATATKQSAQEITSTLESIEEILRGVSEIDAGTRDIMNSVNNIVGVANENTKVIDDVVNQISGQNEGITNITNGSVTLKERVEAISSMLMAISSAMQDVHDSANENEQVSARIADILK